MPFELSRFKVIILEIAVNWGDCMAFTVDWIRFVLVTSNFYIFAIRVKKMCQIIFKTWK